MPNPLESVRIVLCRPSHPGNIGSAARAMKTMGIADLRLVAPQRFPAPEAEWLASGAIDVLEAARGHAALGEAIGDCVAAYAPSARPRAGQARHRDSRRRRRTPRLPPQPPGRGRAPAPPRPRVPREQAGAGGRPGTGSPALPGRAAVRHMCAVRSTLP